MNFITIKTNNSDDEELINLSLIVNIYKENRSMDWREPFGINFATDETEFEAYYSTNHERNEKFDELIKKLTI